MAEQVEESGVRHVGEGFPVGVPDGFGGVWRGDVAFGFFWVVDVPAVAVLVDVVDGPDEEVPVGHGGELIDPRVSVGEVVDFEAEADGDLGDVGAG